jgi:hypothetical protein
MFEFNFEKIEDLHKLAASCGTIRYMARFINRDERDTD